MEKFTLKQLKALKDAGAQDLSVYDNREMLNEKLSKIGYCLGKNGLNGGLFIGDNSKRFYVIIGRCSNLNYFW